MTLARTLAYAVALTSMIACSVEKAEVTEDFSDLAGLDAKSDYFSYRMKLLGTLADGATATAKYTKTPIFRGYDFTGAAGDQVDVWVRSTTGDALAWVLDGKFKVIAKNDDADATTYDAHLAVTLPASADNRYYVVFRDYAKASRTFKISFAHHTATTSDPGWGARAEAKVEQLVADYASLQPFAAPLASMPAAAKARAAADQGALEVATTYKVDVDGRPVYLVVDTDGSGEGNIVVADLIDGSGAWFAHGIGHSFWDGNATFNWSLDDSDPTLCTCAGATATCTWIDGTTSATTALTCP